jgi:hypothetical protein
VTTDPTPPPAPPARSAEQRKRDALDRLGRDEDLWLATASAHGDPYLVPLSFTWHREQVVMATSAESLTVANLRARPTARVALGHTRDVVLIDGDVTIVELGDVPEDMRRDFAERAKWDAAAEPGNVFFTLTPARIRAWREVNELAGRTLMRRGRWIV